MSSAPDPSATTWADAIADSVRDQVDLMRAGVRRAVLEEAAEAIEADAAEDPFDQARYDALGEAARIVRDLAGAPQAKEACDA